MQAIPSWLWITVGWAAVAVGACLLLRGRLLRTRLKKPHCPRCRYSIEGLATLQCPECGRTAKSEREFLIAPRRKRWRLAGVLLLLVGWCGVHTPAMIANGWAAGLPNWAVVLVAPREGISGEAYENARRASMGTAMSITLGPRWSVPLKAPATPPPTPSLLDRLRDDAYVELWRRLGERGLPGWMAKVHLRAAVPADGQLGRGVSAPGEWPCDYPIAPADMDGRAGNLPAMVVTRYEIDQATRASVTRIIEVHAGDAVYELYRLSDAINARQTAREFMGPVSSPEMDAAFAASFTPSAFVRNGILWVEFHAPPNERSPLNALPRLLGVRIRVLLDGELVGAGTCDLTNTYPNYRGSMFGSILWVADGMERAVKHPELVEVELLGDPGVLFPRYLADRTIERRGWGGAMRIKVRPERGGGKP